MTVLDFLFTTEHQVDGRSSQITLPIYTSQFLADLEKRFGPRDRSYTLVGIHVDKKQGNLPCLWYPDSGIPLGDSERRSKHVIVRLASNALTDPVRARWQLAHECLHLLDPWNNVVDGRTTNWLEEGLAAWYQNNSVPEAESHEGSYAVAEDLVKPLMDALPDAIKRIRQELHLRIGDITPDVLRDYCQEMSGENSWKLCQPFSNYAEAQRVDAAIEENPKSLGFPDDGEDKR